MKTLLCSLAAILSVALSSTVLAEERTYTEKITGTVTSVDKQGLIVIDTGKGKVELLMVDDVKAPKVGEKVKAYCWYHNRGRFSTDKIEKLGDTKGDSKQR